MTNTSSSPYSSAIVPGRRRRRRHRHETKDNDGDTVMLGSTSCDDNDNHQTKQNRRKSSTSQREYDDGYLANYKPVPAMQRLNNRYSRLSVSNPEIEEEEMWEENVHCVETVERDKETKELLVYIKWYVVSFIIHYFLMAIFKINVGFRRNFKDKWIAKLS